MGFFKAGLGAGAIVFAGAAFMLTGQGAPPDPEPSVAAPHADGQTAPRFRLLKSGAYAGCDVAGGERVSARKVLLKLAPGCVDELPELADARFWMEREDGSVAFVAEDGRVAIRFAAGDGFAYEAFGAGAPLVSLVAEGD